MSTFSQWAIVAALVAIMITVVFSWLREPAATGSPTRYPVIGRRLQLDGRYTLEWRDASGRLLTRRRDMDSRAVLAAYGRGRAAGYKVA